MEQETNKIRLRTVDEMEYVLRFATISRGRVRITKLILDSCKRAISLGLIKKDDPLDPMSLQHIATALNTLDKRDLEDTTILGAISVLHYLQRANDYDESISAKLALIKPSTEIPHHRVFFLDFMNPQPASV